MEKTKNFPMVRFKAATMKKAYDEFAQLVAKVAEPKEDLTVKYAYMKVQLGNESWSHDSIDEFWTDYAKEPSFANVDFVVDGYVPGMKVEVYQYRDYAQIIVKFPNRAGIERIMGLFDEAAPDSAIPAPVPAPKPVVKPSPRIFVGHGGQSQQWRLLKDHLTDLHSYDVLAYETGARAGHTIRDVLDEMLAGSSFALLVLTAEDAQEDGELRARQNVVHEAGLFQGRLGFARAIILLENGVEKFSNIDGVQYIPFARGNIRETFGDVLATLRREFGSD